MQRIPSLLCFAAAFAVAFAVAPTTAAATPLARGHTKFLGCCYSAPQMTGFANYFNQVVPENASKWGSVEGTRDNMRWAELDTAYQLAKANGLPFKFHTLIWGNQAPTWIDALPADQQLAEIKQWFSLVAARYPDIDLIDVVNEPLHAPPTGVSPPGSTTRTANYAAALGGSGTTGWDWVLEAFRLARTYFPKAKLLINEYSVTNDASAARRYLAIIQLLKTENLVDGVGIQGHYFSTTPQYSGSPAAATATMKANLELLAGAGLPIYITELDIDGGTPPLPNDALQLSEYQRIFSAFWEHPAVAGITLWGFRTNLWRQSTAAYLVLDDNTERPAMQWLRTYLDAAKPTMTAQPQNQAVAMGGNISLTAAATSTPVPTLQWRRNGVDVSGATSGALALTNLQPADTGLYTAAAVGVSATTVSNAAIVGLTVPVGMKVVGAGKEIGTDITHPNGKIFDQVGLEGAAEAITADYDKNQVTRTSFIDVDNDIVQVEFSGPGTLSLVLDGSSAPARPVNYNQAFDYMKGHAGIVITGANENTNVSVFTVGRATAVDRTGAFNILQPISVTNNPANNGSPLFQGHSATVYDGIADIAFIAIASTNGKFGGVRTANANYFASKGLTGLYAPGVAFEVVFIGNITAFDKATPVIQVGSVSDARITGGDLAQMNNAAVQVSGLTQLKFTAGSDSHGTPLLAKVNKAVLQQNGTDVTSQIVVYP